MFHYVTYLLARLGETIVSLLPLTLAFDLGAAAGTLAFLLLPKRRAIALRNLRLALGGEMSESQLRAINRKHFQLLGANLLAGLKAATMPSDKIWKRVTANVPAERPQIAWLAAISHIGCWELFSHLGAQYPQYRFGAVYRRFYNPFLDAYLRRTRARSGTTLFDRRAELLKCVHFMRAGGVVGVLVDQRAGHAGVWTPLFNRLTSSSTLAATLAIRTGAPIQPLAIYTSGRARWKLVFSEPLWPKTEDAELLTAQINALLEQQIRCSPADWLWAHDRWRPNRPGFLFMRDQRRVFIPPGFDRAKLVPFRVLLVAENIETTLPALRAIKSGRPDTWLAVLSDESNAAAWRELAEVAQVIECAESDSFSTLAHRIRSAAQFDAAIFFAPSRKTALAVWLARIPIRVARRCGLMSLLFNLHPQKPKTALDPVRANLRLAKSIGANIEQALRS